MIEILIILILPSCVSLLLYFCLGYIRQAKQRIPIAFAVFLLSLVFWGMIISNFVDSTILAVLSLFITISIAVSCAVAIGMNIFPPGLGKKRDAAVAFISPFISIPFFMIMMITPEMVIGQVYPDYFFSKRLPLSGWLIDALTINSGFVAGGESILPGILLNLGFFIEMIIVMIPVFWLLKKAIGVYNSIPS